MAIKDPRNRAPIRDNSWAYLDEELCFNLWNDLGNIGRAADEIKNRGIINPDTGKPPSRPGVYIAALRYISKNIDDARNSIVEAGGEWANDKLLYLLWVLERMQQSNTLGRRAREQFNTDIVSFAESYLYPAEYQEFLTQMIKIVPNLEYAHQDYNG